MTNKSNDSNIEMTALDHLFDDLFHGRPGIETKLELFETGLAHPRDCRCQLCLEWWVLVGPEDLETEWGFGPFSRDEYIRAGGVIPPYLPNEDSSETGGGSDDR